MTLQKTFLKPDKIKNIAALERVKNGRMASIKGTEERKYFAAKHYRLFPF